MLVGIGAVQTTSQKAQLVKYQQSGAGPLPMAPHGRPDANTSINQGHYNPMDHWPSSQVDFLSTGEQPGTFLRDLSGVGNQVPRWGWFVLGGAFLVLSGLAFNRHRKEKKSGKSKKKR